MDYFQHYMIVGGMPQAVVEYVETHDFMKVDMVKQNIPCIRLDIEKLCCGQRNQGKRSFGDFFHSHKH